MTEEPSDPPRPLNYATPRPMLAQDRPLDRRRVEQAGGLLVAALIFNPIVFVAVLYVVIKVLGMRDWFARSLVSMLMIFAVVSIFFRSISACALRAADRPEVRNGFGFALAAAIVSGGWTALYVLIACALIARNR